MGFVGLSIFLRRRIRFASYVVVLLLLLLALFFQSWWYDNPSPHSNVNIKHRNTKLKKNHSVSAQHLPAHVINNVSRFIFFVGYARSGHSIVGSMLDAHPHVVIAHEYSLFSEWVKAPSLHSNKTWLFNVLFENSQYNIVGGPRKNSVSRKGYSLFIPDWWQGKYKDSIQVIGDKAGGITAQMYRRDHKLFNSTYRQLQGALGGVPISVVHVLRNPYDNIATMLLYNLHKRGNVNKTSKYNNDGALRRQITSYFNQVQSVMDLLKKFQLDSTEVHVLDMITNPKQTMRKLCSYLHLDCSEKYLHMCAQIAYPAESKSRELVEWNEENIRIVAQKILRFTSLSHYTFQ